MTTSTTAVSTQREPELFGQTVVVIGGSAGIGLETARRARAEGDPETQARLAGIRQGLSRFGWSESRNVEINYRYASASAEQARLLAKDLVAPSPR